MVFYSLLFLVLYLCDQSVREKMSSSRFLLLMALSCCVCGLELNVAQSSYQAEENQDVTLDWTFTPKPDPSLKHLFVYCDMVTTDKNLALFHLHDGAEVPLKKDEEFSGRARCDKDQLREGRIRLHVSSLRTEDSGWFRCEVKTEDGVKWDRCRLNVSAVEKPEAQGPAERPAEGPGAWGRIGLYMGLSAAAVGLFCISIVFWFRKQLKSRIQRWSEDSNSSAHYQSPSV